MKARICALAIAAASGLTLMALPASALDANASKLVINEICTSNKGENGNLTDVADSKGKYCDWVEIYNPTDTAVDLSGMYITDDAANPQKSALPDGATVAAHGYYIVYCGKNINSEDYADKAVAKFGLSAAGEKVTITDGENAIDTMEVPALADDLTYARVPSGSADLAICDPTPMADNTAESVHKLAAPQFSRASGAFTESFDLGITAEAGADIYYTTDGSTPDENSQKYTGEINVYDRTSDENNLSAMKRELFTDWYDNFWNSSPSQPEVKVDKGTVIRAVAIKNGQTSGVAAASYFVGIGNDTYYGVPIISVVTDSDNLFDKQTGIYMKDNAHNKGKDWERPVHIDFIEDGEAKLSQDCGMRIQGGYSRGDYQKSLRFYARSSYGADKFNYPIISGITSRDGEGREVADFEKFVLRNGGNDANYTKFKDSMIQSMAIAGGMDYAAQSGRACVAFINGEYWGVYTLQEDYTDSYIKDHYDVKKKNVVIIKPDSDNYNQPKVDEGNVEDLTLWTNDIGWVYAADLTKDADYEKFGEKFDIESLADYFATEIYLSNEDWSGKNWSVWRSREAEAANPDHSDCRWRFMLYDTEMGANLWGNAGESPTNNKLVQVYELGRKDNDPLAVMFYKAMQNEDFAEKFNASLDKAAAAFSSENYNTALSNYKAQYYENLRKYFERFPTGSGIWSADQGISWMNTFFNGSNKRGDYYEVMKESMALMLKYEKFDTSPYTADSVKALKKAYNSLVSTANQTGSGKTAQQNKIDALKKAFDELKLIGDDTDSSGSDSSSADSSSAADSSSSSDTSSSADTSSAAENPSSGTSSASSASSAASSSSTAISSSTGSSSSASSTSSTAPVTNPTTGVTAGLSAALIGFMAALGVVGKKNKKD